MESVHNPYDPLCSCKNCSKIRAEQIARIDAQKKRNQEVVIESGLKAFRQKK